MSYCKTNKNRHKSLKKNGMLIPIQVLLRKGFEKLAKQTYLPNDVFSELKDIFPNIAEKRYDSKCGLTGLPQMVGRDNLPDKERLNLEASYCTWTQTNYSFIVDFKIIFYTVLIVLGIKKKASIDEALNLLK